VREPAELRETGGHHIRQGSRQSGSHHEAGGAQPAPNIGGAIVNIGDPLRIIEVEPLWIPLPDTTPAPTEQPVREPEPEHEPAVPEP
jgi:hypothetical protein